MSTENNNDIEIKANAFAFKAFIDGEYKVCICPRKDDKWSEEDIFYINNPTKELFDSLEENVFHIVFVLYEKDESGGFWIKPPTKSFYVKSTKHTSQDAYNMGQFFKVAEDAYKKFYEEKKDVFLEPGSLYE